MVETTVCWYLQGIRNHSRASWVVRNGFRNHPQYQSEKGPYCLLQSWSQYMARGPEPLHRNDYNWAVLRCPAKSLTFSGLDGNPH